MTQLTFDATQVAPSTGAQDPIPSGWYNAAIDESEMKATKDGLNSYLQCRYNILDGQYAGSKVYQRMNLRNSNPKAQQIAFEELSAVCHATNVLKIQDSQQLHSIPVKIKVKLKPASAGYDAGNEITAVKHMSANVGGTTGVSPAETAPAQQPWQAPAQAAQPAQPAQQPWQAPAHVVQAQQPWQAPVQQEYAVQPWQQAPAPQAPVQQQEPAVQQAPVQPPVQAAPQAPVQQPAVQQQAPQAPAGMPPWATGQ